MTNVHANADAINLMPVRTRRVRLRRRGVVGEWVLATALGATLGVLWHRAERLDIPTIGVPGLSQTAWRSMVSPAAATVSAQRLSPGVRHVDARPIPTHAAGDGTRSVNAMHVLESISALAGRHRRMRVDELEIDGTRVEIRGAGQDARAVAQWLQALREHAALATMTLDALDRDASQVRFRASTHRDDRNLESDARRARSNALSRGASPDRKRGEMERAGAVARTQP